MNIFIIFVGPPCSGKSTLMNEISSILGVKGIKCDNSSEHTLKIDSTNLFDKLVGRITPKNKK